MKAFDVTTYKELEVYINGAVARNIPLLIIRGSGGTGKTYTVREKTKESNTLWINGRETPADFYCKLYDNRNALVVLDDTDGWTKNETMVSILKQAANTEEDKTIQYNTTSSVLGEREQAFKGNHTFILILNGMSRTKTDNMQALLDRATLIEFKPPRKAVIDRMLEYAEDKEVSEFLRNNAFRVDFSLRLYHIAVGLKDSGVNWRKYVSSVYGLENQDVAILEDIRQRMKDPSFTTKERDALWVNGTGKTVRRLQQLLAEDKT